MNDVWGAEKHTHPLGFKQHPARKMLGNYTIVIATNSPLLLMSSDLQPLLECGLVSWTGAGGPAFKSFKPSMAFWKASMAFSSVPNDLLERYVGSWRCWTHFNIHKTKNTTDWIRIISNQLRICDPYREVCFSVFFKLKLSMCRMPVGRSYQFNCSWSWFCLHSSKMFKQNTLPEIATVTIMSQKPS